MSLMATTLPKDNREFMRFHLHLRFKWPSQSCVWQESGPSRHPVALRLVAAIVRGLMLVVLDSLQIQSN